MFSVANELTNCTAGVIIARDITVSHTPADLKNSLDSLVLKRSLEDFPPASLKDAVRNMLRSKAFKPTGRNKPASEYLAQAAKEGRFPFINNLVDVNNYVSLASGLPISLLNLDRFAGGLKLRLGAAGEKYIFNSGGQEIELEGLICACGTGFNQPFGNAIKDSMAGKINDQTKSVVGVIYCPKDFPSDAPMTLSEAVKLFAECLSLYGNAKEVKTEIC